MRPRGLFLCLSLPVLLVVGAAAGCVFRSADDCELTLGFGCKTSTTGSSSSSGGGGGGASTSSTASSSGGGTGGGPTCVDPSLCPDPPEGPCKALATKVCDGGKCAIQYTAGDAPSQQYGSCKKKLCDATGALMEVVDDTNKYDDGNPCTEESCTSGVPASKTLATGSPCVVGGSPGFCVSAADPYKGNLIVCAECDPNGAPTCIGGAICVGGRCVPAHCKDGAKNFGETDIDCGGVTSGCPKCIANKACTDGPTDCWSNLCQAGKCTAPTCVDLVQNGSEPAADCGSLCGQPCADGLPCVIPEDCASKVCMPPAMPGTADTCQIPTCTDGVQNGDETAIDCGGATCPPCSK